ncbi:hypothetical protein MLPF_0115 [Mycobacterium lepromatosis]|nr:hypothetical protein MLPF_0115 [Mycobacterium lepromatosis]
MVTSRYRVWGVFGWLAVCIVTAHCMCTGTLPVTYRFC